MEVVWALVVAVFATGPNSQEAMPTDGFLAITLDVLHDKSHCMARLPAAIDSGYLAIGSGVAIIGECVPMYKDNLTGTGFEAR